MSCSCLSHNGFLTAKGLAEAAQREHESLELAGVVATRYLDSMVSVSGLEQERNPLVWDDQLLDQQYRRFHNGS